MISDEIEISAFAGEDLSSLVELSKTTYPGHEISDERYLFWEYKKNPDGNAIMNVARSGGKVIAQYAVLPRRFNFKGRAVNASVSVNTLTHPQFRGNDLFQKLASETFQQCSEKGVLFTIGFPNPVSLPVIRRKNIFDVIGSLSVLFYPLNPVSSFIRYVKGNRDKSGSEIPLSISFNDNTVSTVDLISSSAGYNKLLNTFNSGVQFTTHRNVDFFKWRYFEIPRRVYFALKQGETEFNAVLVLRAKYIYGIRCLIIVDVIAANQSAVRLLLKQVKAIAKANDIDLIISAMTPHSEEYNTFKSSHYYSIPEFILPQKLAFIVKKHKNCPDEVLNFENWFLTFGDYDIF